jgi:hypothetical protein
VPQVCVCSALEWVAYPTFSLASVLCFSGGVRANSYVTGGEQTIIMWEGGVSQIPTIDRHIFLPLKHIGCGVESSSL